MQRTNCGIPDMKVTSRNRLAGETSPYLQQHANNPVDWYPWGEQALEKARQEDKPILLSIGYSACHWCHVMAHESFEDEATAQVMNELYVNIKIDREERPDLDKIYQTAQALLSQRPGGWPLTIILTPNDQVPFFGGTYFPNVARHGLPPFVEVLKHVEQFYRQHRKKIATQNESMIAALAKIYGPQSLETTLDPGAAIRVRQELEQSFDERRGGFGSAPKFPHPTNIEFLLRHWAASRIRGAADPRALHMAIFSLKKMALGGIYDHLGGGFYRYSVDDFWMIPHFEKMLYDNGLLLRLCSEAAAATGSALFDRTSRETAEWTIREMQSPEGGYYSSLDADSEGEEGKFYVWHTSQIKDLVEQSDYSVLARRFGLDRSANFEGQWHLHAVVEIEELAKEFKLSEAEMTTRLDRARRKLFQSRERRVYPGRDEKILTSWNALMIKGMASTGRYLNQPVYIDSATQALDFIHTVLWRNNRLLATYKDGKAHLNAYLDDYAFLIDGILELLQARWRTQDLSFACALADRLLNHFEDKNYGGFYFTSDDHEQLVQRPKSFTDEAIPSGNGIAALGLLRLGYLLGETRYLEAAERVINQAADSINMSPSSHASLLIAYQELHDPPLIMILRGQGSDLEDWQQRCSHGYAPARITLAIPNDTEDLPPALAEKTTRDGMVAYRCRGMTCSPPLTEWSEIEAELAKITTSALTP